MSRRRFSDGVPPLQPLDDDVIEVTAVEVVDLPEPPRSMPPRRTKAEPVPEAHKPVMPAWMADPLGALKAEAERRWEIAKFHASRSPIYFLRAVRYSPGGAWRSLAGLSVWVRDDVGLQLVLAAAAQGNIPSAERLDAKHDRTVKSRLAVSVFVVLAMVFVGLVIPVLWWFQGGLAKPAAGLVVGLAVLAVLGKVGEPGDRPIVERATVPETVRPAITGELIREAFDAAGLSKPPRMLSDGTVTGGKEITFVREIARSGKHGTETTIDLPLGLTAEKAMKKRPEIASGLSVGRMQVRITPNSESERRIDLYVHDFDPYAQQPPVTPLAKAAKLSFWDGFDFGISAEGQAIRLNLLWACMLIGALPRYGKTWAARLIGAAAALDPHVRLIIFDGAKRGSWKAFAPICHRYAAGLRDDVFEHLIDTLRECWSDIQARADYLDELPTEQNPESKITRELTGNGMPLTVLIIDEIQQYLGDTTRIPGGGKRGEIVLDLLINISKMGGAVGYMLVLATQKPDSDTIPTALRDQCVIRMAMRMTRTEGSKTILGDVPPGMDPIQFTEAHRGVGVLIGAGDVDLADLGPQIVRTYLADNHVIDEICQRAYKLRKHLGTLTGFAAGEQPEDHQPDYLLEDVLEVAQIDDDALPTGLLLERLVAAHPERYDGWTADELGLRLRNKGVPTSHQINRTGEDGRRNLRGIRVDEVRSALAKQLRSNGAVKQ